MKKYKLMKGLIFGVSFSMVSPMVTKASEWDEKVSKWGNTLVDLCQEVDDKIHEKVVVPINDKTSEAKIYKHDSLWLITDMPSMDPKEERHYYFVNKNTSHLKWTFYYDKNGNSISSNQEEIVKTEIRTMYVSLNDLDTVFKIEEWLDKEAGTYTINYEDFDSSNIYNPLSTVKYGRFIHIEDVIPEDSVQEKYSTKDLEEILNTINDLNYEIKEDDTLALKRN